MMWKMVRRCSAGVANEVRDVDSKEVQLMKVNAPSPDSCSSISSSRKHHKRRTRYGPKVAMKPTRYGSGKARLKESSCASTAGSPSIVTARHRTGGNQENKEEGDVLGGEAPETIDSIPEGAARKVERQKRTS